MCALSLRTSAATAGKLGSWHSHSEPSKVPTAIRRPPRAPGATSNARTALRDATCGRRGTHTDTNRPARRSPAPGSHAARQAPPPRFRPPESSRSFHTCTAPCCDAAARNHTVAPCTCIPTAGVSSAPAADSSGCVQQRRHRTPQQLVSVTQGLPSLRGRVGGVHREGRSTRTAQRCRQMYTSPLGCPVASAPRPSASRRIVRVTCGIIHAL